MTGGKDNSDITAEFAALQRLAGGGTGATAGSGLPAVVTSLAAVQKDCGTPLQFASGTPFPDAHAFEAYYTSVLNELTGPQSNAGIQVLVSHVTALADVAHWTTTNYQNAAELEKAGIGVVKDKLDQALANPSANGGAPAGLPANPPAGNANPAGGAQ